MNIGKLAQRAGITTRTLHHYDQIGLLKPSSVADNGYRTYGASDVERLYRILALRELGLPLAGIAAVLAGEPSPIDEILEGQRAQLQAEIDQRQLIVEKLQRLQGRLQDSASASTEEWLELLQQMQLQDRYFSLDELALLRSGAGEWAPLASRVRELMAAGTEASSPAATALAAEWVGNLQQATGGRGELWGKLADMIAREPKVQAQTGIDPGMLAYLAAAIAHLEVDDEGSVARAPVSAFSESAYDLAYQRGAPWDIGQVQPAWSALLEEDRLEGPVLEVGCGTGDLALAMARRHPVLAVDLSAVAIQEASRKGARSDLPVEFKVWNAVDLAGLERRFATVIDCGFFHALAMEDRQRFARELARVTGEGARYVVLGFATRLPLPNAPSPLSAEGMQEVLGPHWTLEWQRPTRFMTRWAQDGVPALMCSLRRTAAAATCK